MSETDLDARLDELLDGVAPLELDESAGRGLRILAAMASFRPPDLEGDPPSFRLGPGDALGDYTVVHRLGGGGMGEVFLARQESPLDRLVAIKLLRGAGTELLRRFDVERRTLAQLEHPHIARIFDAGTLDSKVPYFAMEYVRGLPLDEHCRVAKLDLEARLELFLQVCEGVEHAHRRGVLHRDLKPTNILVMRLDGHDVPRIIDFGIAKLVADDPGAEHTRQGQLLGTPEYMSPEQAEAIDRAVDTRTDVYALGVLLYQLLCDELPIESARLRDVGLATLLHTIRHHEPPPPSSRHPARRSRLRGDLDAICARALAKDPQRRYDSVSHLADDIRRHRRDEPIAGATTGGWHRTRKLLWRHRRAALTAGAVTLAILAGSVLAGVQALRAMRAEERAVEQARRAEAVNEFLVDMLRAANPEQEPEASELHVTDLLDRAEGRLQRDMEVPASVEATLRATLGRAYSVFGEGDKAEVHLERRLDLVEESGDLQERFAARQDLLTHALREKDLAAAANHATALLRLTDTGREAENPALRAQALVDLAKVRARQNRLVEADSLMRRGLGLGRTSVPPGVGGSRLDGLTEYGRLLASLDQLERAEEFLREVQQEVVRRDGPRSARAGLAAANLGWLLDRRGRYAAAADTFALAADILTHHLGPDHPGVARALVGEASSQDALGRHALADSLLGAAEPILRSHFGDLHPEVGKLLSHRGTLARNRGNLQAAEAAFQQSLEIARLDRGEDGNLYLELNNLAAVQRQQGKLEEAIEHFRLARDQAEGLFGTEHVRVAVVTHNLAKALFDSGRLEEAEPLYREAVARAADSLGSYHPNVAIMQGNLGQCYLAQGRREEARQALARAHAVLETTFGAEHDRTARVREWLRQAQTP